MCESALRLLCGCFCGRDGFDTKEEINNVKNPDAGQNNASDRNSVHHDETNGHQSGYRYHDAYFRFHGHAFAGNIAFQVIFVEFCVNKPGMEFFGTAGEAKSCQKQKREGREHGDNCTDSADGQTDTA